MNSFIRFFSSVKLAIILIIILTIASILGTLIPQHRSHEEYLLRYGQLANLLEKIQLTKVYQSFWYLALLFLFALNLTICTLLRLPPKLKKVFRPNLHFQPADITALRLHQKLQLDAPLASVRLNIQKILKDHHYRLIEKKGDSGLALLAQKKMAGLFGADVVHLAILLILIGGLTSGLFSFRADLALHEGETVPIPQAGFSLRLDSFETEYYPGGQVKDWKSTLTILEGEKEVISRTIEVNHPLNYKNYMFYQSAYGWDWDKAEVEIMVRLTGEQSLEKSARVKIGGKVSLNDSLDIYVHRFLPDFVLDENRRPFSRSNEPNNPAALVEVMQGGEKIFSGWLFARFPDFGQIHPDKSAPLSLQLKDYTASQYSVIHVSRDPGLGFIWTGCALIMLGLLLAFYWPPREIRFWLKEEADRMVVFAGGLASKQRENLEKEMELILASLKKRK